MTFVFQSPCFLSPYLRYVLKQKIDCEVNRSSPRVFIPLLIWFLASVSLIISHDESLCHCWICLVSIVLSRYLFRSTREKENLLGREALRVCVCELVLCCNPRRKIKKAKKKILEEDREFDSRFEAVLERIGVVRVASLSCF